MILSEKVTRLPFINVSGYRFVDLDEQVLPGMRARLLERALAANVRGTILLSQEGVNVMLCGSDDGIAKMTNDLNAIPAFEDLWLKKSRSREMTFSRMLVKLKREIIPTGDPTINPAQETGEFLSPDELRRWYREGRDFVIIDTRNNYEVELGSFRDAVNLDLENFRSIERKLKQLDPAIREKPVVTFCTGGIRCEKATPIMSRLGFQDVYQLEGGILAYFEQFGDEFFDGECFVFDKRVAIDGRLEETETTQCYLCQSVLTAVDQASPDYVPGEYCPYCVNASALRSESKG